jgi:hypothetical protein
MTIVCSAFGQGVSLSITGPTSCYYDTFVTLSIFDTYTNFGGSYGMSYWLEVSNALAPYLAIANVTYFTFTDPNNIGTFPFSFNSNSGADPGFMTTTTANGQSGDLGATSNPFVIVPDGSYHIADVTFHVLAAASGIYTLRITTAAPRRSSQLTSDLEDVYFPTSSFVFAAGVPEPSTLALIALTGMATAVMAYRRHK